MHEILGMISILVMALHHTCCSYTPTKLSLIVFNSAAAAAAATVEMEFRILLHGSNNMMGVHMLALWSNINITNGVSLILNCFWQRLNTYVSISFEHLIKQWHCVCTGVTVGYNLFTVCD